MSTPQPGIFVEGTTSHHFLELDLDAAADPQALRDALRTALATPAASGVHTVVGFGPGLWAQLSPDGMPGLRPFRAIAGVNDTTAPATQRQVWVWVHGPQRDEVFARALSIGRALRGTASLELEEQGFLFRDSRDLTGFIDGSANPEADERQEAALIPAGQPGAGGSFVLAQRWVHDLDGWEALSQEEQERVIGRTKPDSVELEGDAMPDDSHVSRTDVGLEIYRRSAPYGSVAEHGLYFLGFSCELKRFDVMLERMFGVSGDGLRDRLTDFSRAVSGSYFFAPGAGALEAALA